MFDRAAGSASSSSRARAETTTAHGRAGVGCGRNLGRSPRRTGEPRAMQRSTATRRLVKSPPELWAELSSEEALGRHLAQFGEIRITRVSPETTVAWEGDRIRGTVELEATGWGTKVSLTAADPEPHRPPRERGRRRRAAHDQRPAAPAQRAAPEPPPAAALEPPPEKPRGFFARLFRRRRAAQPAAGIPGPPLPTPDPSPPTPGPVPGPPAPGPDPTPGPGGPNPGPAPTLRHRSARRSRPHDPQRTVAILTEVLDDLGAAHHRPFSRD